MTRFQAGRDSARTLPARNFRIEVNQAPRVAPRRYGIIRSNSFARLPL